VFAEEHRVHLSLNHLHLQSGSAGSMAPNRRQISWLNTHEIRFPKYAAYYAFAEDTCKKNLQPRMPHEDKGVAVIFSTRSLKSLARKIFRRRCPAEIRVRQLPVYALHEETCRNGLQTRMTPGDQGLYYHHVPRVG
jgi:hypothetical protein